MAKLKKKKVDFLIVYETRVRELENICLLKCELEHRGHTVAVINTWNELAKKKRIPQYNAKVVIVPSMYNDGIYDFIMDLCGSAPKIVNLQWEQIGTMADERNDSSRYVLRGMAHQCMNICWGEKTVERLKERSKIDFKHVRITGQIAMDFCRSEFKSYYLTREQICEKYRLSIKYEFNLFISSFAYVDLPERVYNESKCDGTIVFSTVSVKSFIAILNWFRRLLDERPNQGIIYRPHPAEASHPQLAEMSKRYLGRFKVISELSVKQWILISERVYTWYSTSAAEANALGVACSILRPVKIPRELELTLYDNAKMIETYDAFMQTIDGKIDIALDECVFRQHYNISDKPSFIRVSDAAEMVLLDDDYLINDMRIKKRSSVYLKAKQFAYCFVSFLAGGIFKKLRFLECFRTAREEIDDYTRLLMESNYVSQEEILKIQNQMRIIIGETPTLFEEMNQ